MATGPGIRVDLTGLRFGADAVIGRLSFDVAPGQVVALIGPSGVGKTTLLRVLSGVERGFGGSCLVGGVPAHLAPPPGMVFQDARLLPWADAAANLRLVRPDLTGSEVEALLARVGLVGQAAAYPRQMSGGMQRRLGLARALAPGSGVLLLDEPFVSLDAALVADLQGLLRGVFADSRPTVVMVSHDPMDAARLADRVILLSGRPAQIAGDIALDRASDGVAADAARLAVIQTRSNAMAMP